jgi:DnaJ-class molecular chaperone
LNLFQRILEVDPTCREETIIRKAYLQKVKQYHPDSSFQHSKGDQQKFNEVNQAYETLIVS